MNKLNLPLRFVFGVILCLGLLAFQAKAAIYTVDNTNDSGTGSLRQAIVNANSNPDVDTIVFDSTVFSGAQTIRSSAATRHRTALHPMCSARSPRTAIISSVMRPAASALLSRPTN